MSASGAVAAAVPAPAAGADAAPNRPQTNFLASIFRMVVMYYFMSNFFKKPAPSTDPALTMSNLFQKGEHIDLWVYISDHLDFRSLDDESYLVWTETGIKYAANDKSGERSLDIVYEPSKVAQNNGTVWAHIFVARSGLSPNPKDPTYDRQSTFRLIHPLTVYHPRPKIDRRKNLLGGSLTKEGAAANEAAEKLALEQDGSDKVEGVATGSENVEGKEDPVEFISYWKPNLTIHFVDDFTRYPRQQIPEPIRNYISIDAQSGDYFPTTVVTEFWLLKDKLIPVNETVKELPLSLTVSTLALWKWQLYETMDKSFKLQQTSMGAMESEADELKRVFLEGNPVLLAITFVVSILHTVFDVLSFKNDIQFWNQNKSMEGLSAHSVVMNFFCQLVIFLYLLDNQTSWMIIFSSGASVCIEFWKIGKAMDVSIDRSGRFPTLRFKDRESYTMNKTKEYDALASKYLSYVLYPLIVCYAVYSLIYETHKSWYSWVLGTLTGCVYTFGFIMMCPQLFINYKLKSVAHLPWRQMTYKFLNTIIDDLFAFVIKMPLLHRLSVFRDDLIFLIYLYQRWIYPVDKKRVNEFGFGGAEASGEEAAKSALEESKEEVKDIPSKSSEKTNVGVSEEGLSKRKSKGSSS